MTPQPPVGTGDTPSPAPTGPDDWRTLSYLLRLMAHYAQKAADGRDRTQRVLGAGEVRRLSTDLTHRLERILAEQQR